MKNFNVGLIQITTIDDKKANIKKAEKFISEISKTSDIIVLPEMWNCPYQNSYFKKFAEEPFGETFYAMKDFAKKNGIYLIGGSIPVTEGEKIYNRSYVFDRNGKLIYQYSKINLFDIEGFKESDTITAGKSLGVFETEFGIFGLCICYDMRFPEEFSFMHNLGAEAIFVPSTFTVKTGQMHWDILTKARAVDNQCFIIAASIGRDDNLCKNAYGHSNIVSPFGEELLNLGEGENLASFDIDASLVDKMRKKLPLDVTRRNRRY